jgi:hypothetical protein
MPDHYDALETRDPGSRERRQAAALPGIVARARLGQASQGHRYEIGEFARRARQTSGAAQGGRFRNFRAHQQVVGFWGAGHGGHHVELGK